MAKYPEHHNYFVKNKEKLRILYYEKGMSYRDLGKKLGYTKDEIAHFINLFFGKQSRVARQKWVGLKLRGRRKEKKMTPEEREQITQWVKDKEGKIKELVKQRDEQVKPINAQLAGLRIELKKYKKLLSTK